VIWHRLTLVALVLKAGRKWHHYHVVSHVCGPITLAIQSRSWCHSLCNSIGICNQM